MNYLYLFLATLICDLGVKYFLNTSNIESITLIPYFLDYFLTKNTGIALSLFSSAAGAAQGTMPHVARQDGHWPATSGRCSPYFF